MPPQLLEWASAHRLVTGVIVGAIAIAQAVLFQAIGDFTNKLINHSLEGQKIHYGSNNRDSP